MASPTDMYAFGLILSELFAGRHALQDLASPPQAAWQDLHARHAPRPLCDVAHDLPRDVEALYYACLEKRPEDRPTAGEALALLRRAAATRGEEPYRAPDPYPATPDTPAGEGWRWYRLGRAHAQFALASEALDRMQRAVELLPEESTVLAHYGRLLVQVEGSEDGFAHLERALALARADDERAYCIGQRAKALRARKRFAEADADYAAYLDFRPEDATIWHVRAGMHVWWARGVWEAGHLDEALDHLREAEQAARRAIALRPDDTSFVGLFGAVRDEVRAWGTGEPWTRCEFRPGPGGGLELAYTPAMLASRQTR